MMVSNKYLRLFISGVELSIVALFLLSCCTKPEYQSLYNRKVELWFQHIGTDIDTTIIAEVITVTPVGRISLLRKDWQVGLNVIDIINTKSDIVKVGDNVELYVHSVVLTFGVDWENITGKRFKLHYIQKFKKKYNGDILVAAMIRE